MRNHIILIGTLVLGACNAETDSDLDAGDLADAAKQDAVTAEPVCGPGTWDLDVTILDGECTGLVGMTTKGTFTVNADGTIDALDGSTIGVLTYEYNEALNLCDLHVTSTFVVLSEGVPVANGNDEYFLTADLDSGSVSGTGNLHLDLIPAELPPTMALQLDNPGADSRLSTLAQRAATGGYEPNQCTHDLDIQGTYSPLMVQ